MRSFFLFAVAVAVAGMFIGCQSSHEEGVKSDLRTQWTSVAADVSTTTDAARAVLDSNGLKDVNASSTNVDGMATGKKADDTKVSVSIKKSGDKASQVSVTVGSLGEPTLGAQIAKQIKDRAEGHM